MGDEGTEDRLPQLRLLREEVEKQLDSYERRLTSMDARSGSLAAASALVGALSTSTSSGWVVAATAAASVATVLGVVALFPRRGEVPLAADLRDKLYGKQEGAALLYLTDLAIGTLERNEPRLTCRARLIQAGFGALSIAVVLLFLSTIHP